MKRQAKQIQTFLSIVLALGILVASTAAQAASSASLYLSSASTTVVPSGEFSVSLRENSGPDNVNAVQASLTYPEDLVSVISVTSSPVFAVEIPTSYSSGAIKITRGAYPSVSGDQLVATIVFRSLGASGVATFNFDQSKSAVVKAGSPPQNILTTVSGSSFNLVPAAKPAPPVSAPTPVSPPSAAPTPVKTETTPAKKAAPNSLSASVADPSLVSYRPPTSRTWQPVTAVSIFAGSLWGASLLTARQTRRKHLHLFSHHILKQLTAS